MSVSAELQQKREKNLKPFQKGEARARLSPGRPRTADIKADILKDYEKNGPSVIEHIRKKRPELYLGYGFGKPVETILHGGAEDAPPIKTELIQAAAEAAKSV